MFFRRVFSRKDNGSSTSQFNDSRQNSIVAPSPKKQLQRHSSSEDKRGLSVLQLTPLWEHIIRTRTLPDNLNHEEMFEEFLERLRDPEWQVRQHALRVLVDVLIVIGQKADTYFAPLVPQLVENLGHQAPTVRKGALDALRVYISETAMPETILLEIMDIGLNQRITNEPFGGRLTCGVMLSLPSLVQATLHTNKRNYILRSTIDLLVNKMTQVTHQEVTLKVLIRIRDIIGPREFSEYMTHGAHREFELLCNVYGLEQQKHTEPVRNSWQLLNSFEAEENSSINITESFWRSSEDGEIFDSFDNKTEEEHANVIMETEIKINDDTLTMRILESKDEVQEKKLDNTKIVKNEDKKVDETVTSVKSEDSTVLENTGLIQVLTDSELEEINNTLEVSYGRRTPKRVTFGGEIVKMRTPDSDTVAQSDADETLAIKCTTNLDNLNFLTIEIPNDYTKPVSPVTTSPSRPKSSQINNKDNSSSPATTSSEGTSYSPASTRAKKAPVESPRLKSASPKHRFRRISISPVDNIISPKTPHKEVEVLHNLQRSPSISPTRSRRASKAEEIPTNDQEEISNKKTDEPELSDQSSPNIKNWEDLNLVNQQTIQDLKSGDWRHRSRAICNIEEVLRSSENLARIQPCLDSLLRTLLSSEKNADVAEDKRRVLMNLISRLPLDNLEDRTGQIIIGLCRQGGAGSNRVSKTLMQRLPPAVIVLKLLSEDLLHARSSRFRENALQMVMYALMTFPSTYFDTGTCVTRATQAALDRKKRVRQAALDVLAVLGQVTSPRTVMDIVQSICSQREEGYDLCAGVKARLARKQLPIVSADGTVQYALRIPSPQYNNTDGATSVLGADIEWITAGIGSVSPTSLKRRTQQFQQPVTTNHMNEKILDEPNRNNGEGRRLRAPHEILAFGVGVKPMEELTKNNGTRGNFGDSDEGKPNVKLVIENGNTAHNVNTKTANGVAYSMNKHNTNGKQNNIYVATHSTGPVVYGNRLGSNSFSDSSNDGRSSDSKGGGRHSRSQIASRFPTMDRMDMTGIYLDRQGFRNPYEQNYGQHHMNSTFPKANYTTNQKKVLHKTNQIKNHSQDAFAESSFEEIYGPVHHPQGVTFNRSQKRFTNIDKFIPHSNKPEQKRAFEIATQHSPDIKLKEDEVILRKIESNHHIAESQEDDDKPYKETSPTKRNITPHLDNKPSQMEQTNEHSSSSCVESSEVSSEERCSSGHSTPTRPMGELITPLSMPPNEEEILFSRPESNKSFKSEKIISRPQSTVPSRNSEVKVSRPQSAFSGKSYMEPEIGVMEVVDLRDDPKSDNEDVTTVISIPLEEPVNDLIFEKEVEKKEESLVQKTPKKEVVTPLKEKSQEETIDVDVVDNVREIKPSEEFHAGDIVIEEVSDVFRLVEPTEEIPPTPSPVVDIKPITSNPVIAKSYDSIFQSPLKNDIDNKSVTSTETSSDYQGSHAASLDDKDGLNRAEHTPLRKCKTTLFSRNRKISPGKHKQSIKLSKAEIFPQSLTRFERPKEALHQSLGQLDSSNWETIVIGLRSLVRVMRYHPNVLETQIHMVCIQLGKSVKNLRSQVSRAGCQASGEFFTIPSKMIEQECDDLCANLLHRTADTNRFLRADATRALESMVDSLPPTKVLHILTTRGITHQNAVVRTTVAKLLHRLAVRLGSDRIYNMSRDNRDKFFINGATLLMEGSLETRSYAKALFQLLSEHPNYSRLILEVIPSKTYRNIEKTLKSIM